MCDLLATGGFMLSFSRNSLTILATIMSLAPSALFARYDGPRVDYNFIMQEPKAYEICDRYINDSARHMSSCVKGRDEARRMASRFAGGEGRLEGYLRGYSWGLNKMVNAYKDNAVEMEEGAKLVGSLNEQLQVGIQAGIRAGQKDGGPLGAQEARGRFYSAINSGQMPSGRYEVPATNYQGEDNAYTRYVGKVPTAQEILAEDSNIGDLPVFHEYDRSYLGEPERRSARYFWYQDGLHTFQTQRWDNAPSAWSIWQKLPNDARPDYDNINVGAPRTPVSTDPTTGQQTGGELITDFKTIWKDAFVASYAYYANFYFSKSFHENIDMGQVHGEGLGIQVGKRVARTKGLERAFNTKFKESSRASYRSAFSEAYAQSFEATFADYSNNAKLSIDLIEVVGADNDGIIQPGERIALKFKITNAGGVGSNLRVSAKGDLQNINIVESFSVNALESKVLTTPFMANVDNRLQARQRATITLVVNGLEDTLGQQVNQMVEFSARQTALNINQGSGTLSVVATNVSTVTTPGIVSADLVVDGKSYNAIAGTIEPGISQRLVLQFSGIDPLTLINSSVKATVTLKHNGRELDTYTQDLAAEKRTDALVSYFTEASNSKAFIPDFLSEDNRVEALINQLAIANGNEVATHSKRGGYNIYRKDPEATVVGKLASSFEKTIQNEKAKDRFDSLAKITIKERKKFKRFLFWAPKQSHYTDLVRKFSKNKKLK
jgi:hypothetical protein